MSAPSPAAPPRTITAALAAHHLAPAAYAAYAPYQTMTARFLGEPPSFYPVLALSPAAIRTHVGLFARMFHAPGVDMRLPGHPSPALRRAVFLASSEAFDCTYCSAHAAAFGDMLRGCIPRQRADGGAQPEDPRAPLAAALGAAAAARPESAATRADAAAAAAAVRSELGAGPLEVLCAVAAFTGALNTVMDVQGVELEPGVQAFAAVELGSDGKPWEPGAYHGCASADTTAAAPPSSGGALSNLADLAATLPAATSAMAWEATTLYSGIPLRLSAQLAYAETLLPVHAAAFLPNIAGAELRRAFLFGLRENYRPSASSPRCFSAADRARVLHAFAATVNSPPLAAAAAALFARAAPPTTAEADAGAGAGEDTEAGAADALRRWADAPDEEAGGAALVAARRLTVAEATSLDNISPELVAEVTHACTPEAVIELASLLSFAEMWRRMLLLFSQGQTD